MWKMLLLVSFALFANTSCSDAFDSKIPRAKHVIVVVEENHQFSDVYPDGMPWLVSQAQSNGAIAANFRSPIGNDRSLGAYLWLSSGSKETKFGCSGMGCTSPITSENIFGELTRLGRTWKVYAQGLPSVGYLGDGPFPYVKRHNPAVWYSSVLDYDTDRKRVVPFSEFAVDLRENDLPEYSLVIPDLLHDAHSGTLLEADAFLRENLGSLFQSAYFEPNGNGLFFLTFDECGNGTNESCHGHVFTALIGPWVRKGYVSPSAYSHSDMLRTMEDALDVHPYFGTAESARAMADFF